MVGLQISPTPKAQHRSYSAPGCLAAWPWPCRLGRAHHGALAARTSLGICRRQSRRSHRDPFPAAHRPGRISRHHVGRDAARAQHRRKTQPCIPQSPQRPPEHPPNDRRHHRHRFRQHPPNARYALWRRPIARPARDSHRLSLPPDVDHRPRLPRHQRMVDPPGTPPSPAKTRRPPRAHSITQTFKPAALAPAPTCHTGSPARLLPHSLSVSRCAHPPPNHTPHPSNRVLYPCKRICRDSYTLERTLNSLRRVAFLFDWHHRERVSLPMNRQLKLRRIRRIRSWP